MKEILKRIINKPIDTVTLDDLMNCFELIKDDGDIAMIKFDGPREIDHYTVVFIIQSLREGSVRIDDASLKSAAMKALTRYYNLKYASSNGNA